MQGQINLQEYMTSCKKTISSCSDCVCRSCLLWHTNRCPHGDCFDDLRALQNPYDKAHPDEPPRTGWSSWKTDQAYWCRGGALYPVRYCKDFIKYKGCRIEECLKAVVAIYQDGYVSCSLVESMGCEACYQEFERKEVQHETD